METNFSFSDKEGNTYPTIRIGNKLWIIYNLITTRFQNGDEIPIIESDEEWGDFNDQKKPACCWYNNHVPVIAKVGLLYNWYVVCDSRSITPVGWRIPGIQDWADLVKQQGGWNIAGRKLKNKTGWNHEGNGNNLSGFSALPGGGRGALGSYLDIGEYGNWWCKEETSEIASNFFYLTFLDSTAKIQEDGFKGSGLSIRLVKDL